MKTSNQLMEPELELLITERILLHYNRLKAKKLICWAFHNPCLL